MQVYRINKQAAILARMACDEVFKNTGMSVCMCACTYISVCMHVHVCACMYMCVCMHACVIV